MGDTMPPPGSIIRVPQPWYVDPVLRVAGAGLIGLAVVAICQLVGMVRTIPFHPATAAELSLAAAAVLGMSAGLVMLCQGARMFDRVVIAGCGPGHAASAQAQTLCKTYSDRPEPISQ